MAHLYDPPSTSPPRQSFASYRDPFTDGAPSSGSRPNSRIEQDNYFGGQIPAPHHMSGHYPGHSRDPSMEQIRPLSGANQRGAYLSPAAAAVATDTVNLGAAGGARSGEISMIGGGAQLSRESTWLARETNKQNRGRKFVITALVIITSIVILAIALGVYFGTRNSKNSNRTASNGNKSNSDDGGSTTTAGVVETDPNDPSKFTKDPNLKNSFYGIAYTMADALYPDCNQGLPATIEDMQLMSQLTNRIRLYGSDCNQTSLVLEAIRQTKVDMKVFVAVYIVLDDEEAYERQKSALKEALETYGADNIEGVTVGNEYMLNYITKYNADNADGTVGLEASAHLKEKIKDVRDMLADMKIDLPVGTADAGAYFNTDLLRAVDFGLSNIHAWFAQTTIDDSASWTETFFQETNVDVAEALSNKPQMYIAETGWPTNSSTTEDMTNGAAEASVANLQTFMDTFVCDANQKGIKYFFFEFMDITWKRIAFPGVEGYWGLFDEHKKLKDINLPDCAHD